MWTSTARLEFPQLRGAVISRQDLFKTKIILIAERASGIQLIAHLRLSMTAQVIGISPDNDKQSRLMAQSPRIEAGRVHLPAEAHWQPDFIREATTFLFAKHDDQVDSLSKFLALAWQRECRGEPRVPRNLIRSLAHSDTGVCLVEHHKIAPTRGNLGCYFPTVWSRKVRTETMRGNLREIGLCRYSAAR